MGIGHPWPDAARHLNETSESWRSEAKHCTLALGRSYRVGMVLVPDKFHGEMMINGYKWRACRHLEVLFPESVDAFAVLLLRNTTF